MTILRTDNTVNPVATQTTASGVDSKPARRSLSPKARELLQDQTDGLPVFEQRKELDAAELAEVRLLQAATSLQSAVETETDSAWLKAPPAGCSADPCSCFISYSTKDEEFVQRLRQGLAAGGIGCGFDKDNFKTGGKFRVIIDEWIQASDKLLLVLSEHSVKSDWVEKEVETALEMEREQKRTAIFPIRLDDAVKAIKTGCPGGSTCPVPFP